MLILLLDCFREFALTWYKQQRENENENEIVKKNLNEWLEILIIVFFTKFFANFSFSKIDIFASNSFVFRFSSQYHFCFNCFAFFSLLIRLLQHIQKIICQKTICKQCEKVFESQNKLHEHIRQHHVKSTKKMIKNVSKRNFNRKKNKILLTISLTTISSISFKTTTKFSIFRFVIFSERSRNSSISFVIFAVIASIILSKRSSFSFFTYKITSNSEKITSKFVEIASINDSFIFLTTFSSMFRKSISKHYFTIDDLIRMFVEKSKSFDLSQH